MVPKIIEERRQRQAKQQLGKIEFGPQGCVCPPTCEKTCKNPNCPRQDHRTMGQKLREANQ